MADTIFTQANIAPDLTTRDNNFTADLYLAPKSKGLGIDATAGYRRAGALDPGSYQVTNETSTNATRLGTTRSKKKSHINQQDFGITANMPQITAFGESVRLKTTMNINPVTVAFLTTTSWTVDAGNTGNKIIEMNSVTGLSGYTGKALMIEVGTGAAMYTVYDARLENIDGTNIVLEKALDDAPAAGNLVKVVDYVEFEPGGGQLANWSLLSNISGDEGDKLIHHVKDAEVTDGGISLPADNVGMTNLTFSINPEQVIRNGRKQDKFMTERIKYE